MKLVLMLAAALAPVVWGQGVLEVTSPLGTKFYSLPDEKGAVAAARKAADADPKNVDLLLKLAQAQASVWLEREAVETCTRGLALDPGRADLLTERGHRCTCRCGEFQEGAHGSGSLAVEIEPEE